MAPPSRDGHVAADDEGEPAEHLLLGQLRAAADELPDAPVQGVVAESGDGSTRRRAAMSSSPRYQIPFSLSGLASGFRLATAPLDRLDTKSAFDLE
jgi:hypothetical protein